MFAAMRRASSFWPSVGPLLLAFSIRFRKINEAPRSALFPLKPSMFAILRDASEH
jgi:hypothetical protein